MSAVEFGSASGLAGALTAVALVVVSAVVAFRALRTPAVVPAHADEQRFSALRAMRHVEDIARAPRPVGSAEHIRVRDHLVRKLSELGLSPEVQTAVGVNEVDGMERGTRFRSAGEARNVVAVVPGAEGAADRPAVLLVAHYDSVSSGPGANDNAAAVATLLETARALLAAPNPLRNDVILLFTDAEEVGQLGARAFADRHPLRKRVGVVLNFEARGSRGPVLMFETGPRNGRLVTALAGAVRPSYASSLFHEVYRRMPNLTDFGVFREKGLPGLNFAYIDGYQHYHSASDTPDNVSRSSLQHQGEHALGLARRLGDADLTGLASRGDSVFFRLPHGLARYPATWSLPLSLATVTLWATVVALSIVDSQVHAPSALLGALVGAAWLVAAVLTLGTLPRRIVARGPETTFHGHPRRGGPAYLVALVAATVGSYALLIQLLRPYLEISALAVGGTVWWVLLTLATARRLASANYLAQWPLLFAALGLAVLTLPPAAAESPTLVVAGLALGAVVPVHLLAPLVHLTFVGLLLKGSVAPTAVVGSLTLLLTPVLNVITLATGWALPIVAAATALVGFTIAGVSARPTTSTGRFQGVLYALDTDTGKALWATVDDDHHALDRSAGEVGRDRLREFLPHSLHHFRHVPAPALPLPGPTVTVVDDHRRGDHRHLQLTLSSPRGATDAVLVLSGARVLAYAVEKVPGPPQIPSDDDFSLWLHGIPTSGLRIDLVLRPDRPAVLRVVDRTPGLPESAPTAAPDPAPALGPGTACGATHVRATTRLQPTPPQEDAMPGFLDDDDTTLVCRVVVNDEEQYSIWPADRENPPGWRDSGFTGTRQECLAHIDRTWTDMRPGSLR